MKNRHSTAVSATCNHHCDGFIETSIDFSFSIETKNYDDSEFGRKVIAFSGKYSCRGNFCLGTFVFFPVYTTSIYSLLIII